MAKGFDRRVLAALGATVFIVVIGVFLLFFFERGRSAKVTVVCAVRNISDGETIVADEVAETLVNRSDLPFEFLPEREADSAAKAGTAIFDFYLTKKEHALGRLSVGIAKGQMIVHRQRQSAGLGGATIFLSKLKL
jgi:hypothetical protein